MVAEKVRASSAAPHLHIIVEKPKTPVETMVRTNNVSVSNQEKTNAVRSSRESEVKPDPEKICSVKAIDWFVRQTETGRVSTAGSPRGTAVLTIQSCICLFGSKLGKRMRSDDDIGVEELFRDYHQFSGE